MHVHIFQKAIKNMKFLKRFTGYAWGPYSEFLRNPKRYGGRWKSQIECSWTTPDHFAHNNYNLGHLPQLCIKSSGWKARLLALIFWPPVPYEPGYKTFMWWKNGDHPGDDVWRPYEDTGAIPLSPREGRVVRYFRHPQIDGESRCDNCSHVMNNHGWLDVGEDGKKVCPGTYLYADESNIKNYGTYKTLY